MFKFNLTIATSAFLLMSGSADLFVMPMHDADQSTSNKVLVPINHMPKDVIKMIFIEASQGTNPRRLTFVCKPWYSVMRENHIPEMAELHYSPANILHTAMNPFMHRCMETYWENLFDNGILRYMPVDNLGQVIEGRTGVTSKFSEIKKRDGLFDLPKCGEVDDYLVITESMDHFFKVGEENKNKIVIGIMPSYRILQAIKNSPEHLFVPLKEHLCPDEAPVVLVWRWGDDTNLTWFDYLGTARLKEFSSKNLYQCCQWGEGSCVRLQELKLKPTVYYMSSRLFMSFLSKNKDY